LHTLGTLIDLNPQRCRRWPQKYRILRILALVSDVLQNFRSSRPHHHRTIARLHAARTSRGEGNDPIKRGVVGYSADVCRNRGVPDFGGEIAQPVRIAGSDWPRRTLRDERMDALQSFVLALRDYASNVGILDCYFSAEADSVVHSL
jgi:hypothetical protein